ncbi:MAG: MATE family efflux transporter [Clostridiaceae bacterium]|nr:MATE family efflux transporter [Clostridiaceae bacterium]
MAFLTRDRDFYKRFFTLTLMIALQNLVTFSVNLADNVMIGAYSETALAGVALVNQIQFLLQMIVGGACEAVVILASRAWGRRDLSPVPSITGVGMRFSITVATAIFAVAFFAPTWMLTLLTNEAAIIAEGAVYLRVVCFSYFFYAASAILLATLRSVETVRIGFIVSVISLLINVFLNWILIFGRLGAPALGTLGAAIATVAARVAELIVVIVYCAVHDQKIHLRLADMLRRGIPGTARSFFRVGWPMMLSGATWGLAMGIQSSILGHLGQSAISANSIATTLFQIVSVVAYGSANGTSVLIGKTIGEGRLGDVRTYAKTVQVLYLGIGIVTGLTIFVLKDPILRFYSLTDDTMAMARQFMTVLAVTSVGTAYQMPSLCGIVRGGGQTDFVLYNDLIFMWLIVLPVSALSAFVWRLNPVIVFAALKSDQILKCFVAVVKVNRFTWIRTIDGDKAVKAA